MRLAALVLACALLGGCTSSNPLPVGGSDLGGDAGVADLKPEDLGGAVCTSMCGQCTTGACCPGGVNGCCAPGEYCDGNGKCRCGAGPACTGGNICATGGPVRPGGDTCGAVCCGSPGMPCPL
jgi:hypothetical protein